MFNQYSERDHYTRLTSEACCLLSISVSLYKSCSLTLIIYPPSHTHTNCSDAFQCLDAKTPPACKVKKDLFGAGELPN